VEVMAHSWSNQLLSDLTLPQARFLLHWWKASEGNNTYPEFKSTGQHWMDCEWIGIDQTGTPTHCRIQFDHPALMDLILTKHQIDVFCFELRSEINRAFDKPEQSPFRRYDRIT
jgi:hypothetical protein